MTMHTTKGTSGKAYGFVGDSDTYVSSSAANAADIVVGGSTIFTGSLTGNVDVKSVADGKPVRINSRNYTQTSGSSIAFQAKPAQTVASTGSVIGCEISPRANSGIAVANVIGAHIDAYLKGTAAGTISGDVRGLQIEMVTDDAGTRDIGGNVSAIRIRSAFSGGTITGKFVPVRIEKPETQTNSKTYDAVFELTGQAADCWSDDPTTELNNPGGTVKGYIKVLVNNNARYIALYEKGNLAD